jgi:hypothetical protein
MGDRVGVMTAQTRGPGAAGLVLAAFFTWFLAGTAPARAAQAFGDIDVSPLPSHDGVTHHGYREYRILLENRSARESHRVTLVLPDRSYAWGNSLRRLSRTTTLGPGAQAEVSLWQPPLPIFSGTGMEVLVDGESLGPANVPNTQRHVPPGSTRGHAGVITPSTFLLGRSLDPDEFSRSLHGIGGAPLSVAKAVGPPDAAASRGIDPNAWMPDPSSAGPHWIELDYANPISGGVVEIHDRLAVLGAGGTVLRFKSASGADLVTVPIAQTGLRPAGAHHPPVLVGIPPTSEPIRSLRIEIPPGQPACIDAVGISTGLPGAGATGYAWATHARASSEASGAAATYLGGQVQGQPQFLRAELPTSDWSAHWLSYTPYDAIVLGRTDQSLMTGAVLAALHSYVAAGGCLVLLGDPDAVQRWEAANQAVPLDPGHRLDLGFGHCFLFPAESPADLAPSATAPILAAAESSARFWQMLPLEEAANSLFPVVESVAIPARGIILVMLGFVLLIGPVNLMVLSRLKRRIWMLWTIPAISLATCGLVFVYSFVREGFTPDCRLESLTYLDQASRQAASVAAAAYYCPLTPSDGLRFTADTEATPLVQADYQMGTSRELDWTQAQHLRRGWITARVPAHFFFRKSEARRERLQFSGGADTLEVVNGLGAPVISLLLSDSAGQLYQASRIAAGQKAPLLPAADGQHSAGKLGPRALFQQAGFAGHSALLATNAAAFLLPGTYLAELDGSPFLETGFGERSIRTRSRAYVYGVLDPPPAP